MDEPPPSYADASKIDPATLELDLSVHLTPRLQRDGSLPSNEINRMEILERNGGFRRPSTLSYTSCMSSEMDDDSLPSYSDAIKKMKRKKKRSIRNRSRRISSNQGTEGENLIHSRPPKILTKSFEDQLTLENEIAPCHRPIVINNTSRNTFEPSRQLSRVQDFTTVETRESTSGQSCDSTSNTSCGNSSSDSTDIQTPLSVASPVSQPRNFTVASSDLTPIHSTSDSTKVTIEQGSASQWLSNPRNSLPVRVIPSDMNSLLSIDVTSNVFRNSYHGGV